MPATKDYVFFWPHDQECRRGWLAVVACEDAIQVGLNFIHSRSFSAAGIKYFGSSKICR